MAVRIRRPSAHKVLLDKLCEDAGNPFNHYYEVLVFSAALGFVHGVRGPFTKTDETVRWEAFQRIDGAAELVDMLAAAAVEERDVLADEQAEQRYRIFEEYANGGLEVIAKAIAASPAKRTREVVLDLVLSEQAPAEPELDFDSLAETLN
jgi:dnd system-associated protein 4